MAERIYVALDLETTGLEANRDAVIEIAAVRFQGERILDHFATLINPQRSIPLRIQQMTGIRNADVAAAPTLAQVAPELLSFVRSDVSALVAHNAGFDLGFLQAAGLYFRLPALDTFELATLLLPNCASYNLGELCRRFALIQTTEHRALSDAEATARLFMLLHQRLGSLPGPVIELIVASAQSTEWPLRFLFEETRAAGQTMGRLERLREIEEIKHSNLLESPSTAPSALSPAPVTGPTQFQPLSPHVITDFFAQDGALAQEMGAAYEMRSGQLRMAQQVAAAFNAGEHLLIEAGTGTGKSLAYLLPAALWSVSNQQRIVIATNTIALQDQLIESDLPQIQRLLARTGYIRPRLALLKGRSNYLCTHRLNAWRSGRKLTAAEVSLLAKVVVWLSTTRAGDVSELLLTNATERAIWLRICSDAATCTPERCGAQLRIGENSLPQGDFFFQARARADQAHLVVVNHALLLADIAAGGRVLPSYDHVIIDEAHHLADVATEQLTNRVEWRRLTALCHSLTRNGELTPMLEQAARKHHLVSQEGAPLATLRSLATSAAQAQNDLQEFGERLLHFVVNLNSENHESKKGSRDAEYGTRPASRTPTPEFRHDGRRIAIDSRLRSQPLWSRFEVEWEHASAPLRMTVEHLAGLVQRLEYAQWRQTEPTATLLNEVGAVYDQLNTMLIHLDSIIFAPKGQDGLVKWLEVSDGANALSLAAAPLYVNDILEQAFIQQRRSAIFTSATLRTHTGFSFMQERLGLWDVPVAVVESPFDFTSSTLLLMPSNLPAPNQANYQHAVEQAIIEAAQAAGGHTVALFTSHHHLRQTAEAIRIPLDRSNITVLQHGASSRNRLLREYRRTERAVLLGTRSFWEGIDLPGDELLCLLIARLPFAVPSDPMVVARTADLEDAFYDYTLPEAVLRFRQGFGRLIRRATDRGVVIVLDSRVWQKEYGRSFLDALPGCTIRRPSLANLGDEIRQWLG
jgi:DNA polymerase-3 subunit epsilon/ATP-dependent DNA helicase DinG